MKFNPMEEVLKDFKKGKMIIVTDDEKRENEGDLVMSAAKVTPRAINFMAKNGRGLICVPLSVERARFMKLQPMVEENRDNFETAFTVSVDAKNDITTGISAHDRAHTIRILTNIKARPGDLISPGHIFPLVGKVGGVLTRAGHTEAAIDLAKLSGHSPAGVICEIMNEDGTMARLPQLIKFAKKHSLKMCSIAQLIEYRREKDKLIRHLVTTNLPTRHGVFKMSLFESVLDKKEHIALVMGDIKKSVPIMVRVHSECLTGDVFGSGRCDCGYQLDLAMRKIARVGNGVILYMRQEGRGIGLANKLRAYELQDGGLDTVEANVCLGFKADLREYGIGAQILSDLGIRKIRLMTNNPKKLIGLDGFGLKVTERIPLLGKITPHNKKYLTTKKEKLGHMI
ncbi:MAG: bifunctional 3,4-dihydroxy-2-butanone-4-phosphate synthase/GTP cyclohydrolase II [Candidatus Ancaeobacter aquaticus]|nr:bifunctional 3,4-dihydroxy-2-butanone-4-phosphate synthase/GTP cyclohydrolase II [Candidatus Ancaeobacter aquaticus]